MSGRALVSSRSSRTTFQSSARSVVSDNKERYQQSGDAIVQYTPYYSRPSIKVEDKEAIRTTRLSLSKDLRKSSTFPEQLTLSSRSSRRLSGILLAQSWRKGVLMTELEHNRRTLLETIERKKSELKRKLQATDRALRVKQQLKTFTAAEGSAIAAETNGRLISANILPVARFNKYGFRSDWDSSEIAHGLGLGDTINYRSQYSDCIGTEKQRTSRSRLFNQQQKCRFPVKEAEFTKFAHSASMANVNLKSSGHGLLNGSM